MNYVVVIVDEDVGVAFIPYIRPHGMFQSWFHFRNRESI